MPYTITKLNNDKYQVKNVKSGKIVAKGTTKQKADNMVKFLSMLDSKKKKK